MQETSEVQLTPRETQVLQRRARGLTIKEIARELGLKSGTVSKHCSNLYAKLGASDGTQAVLRAAELGLIECPGLRRDRGGGG